MPTTRPIQATFSSCATGSPSGRSMRMSRIPDTLKVKRNGHPVNDFLHSRDAAGDGSGARPLTGAPLARAAQARRRRSSARCSSHGSAVRRTEQPPVGRAVRAPAPLPRVTTRNDATPWRSTMTSQPPGSTVEARPDGPEPDPALPPTELPAAERETRWTLPKILVWAAIALLGGISWTMIAIVRGETVNALWFVFAAVCTYLIGYRFYSKVIERYITRPDDRRGTPAEVRA